MKEYIRAYIGIRVLGVILGLYRGYIRFKVIFGIIIGLHRDASRLTVSKKVEGPFGGLSWG